MTSVSSKAIPYIVMAILFFSISVETFTDYEVNIEDFIPILAALGIGGIPLTVAKKAIEAKKAIDTAKVKEAVNSA